MRVVLVGEGPEADLRAETLRSADRTAAPHEIFHLKTDVEGADLLASLPSGTGVVFSSGTVHHYSVLSEIARRGMHLFLEWPGSTSVPECQALAELGVEAGVEIGISRPLRFFPWPNQEDLFGHVEVMTIRQALDVRAPGLWKRSIEDAVDLAFAFVRGASPRRIDAAVARSDDRLPLATAAGVRFHNGTYVQLEVRHVERADPTLHLSVAGRGRAADFDLSDARADGLKAETVAYLDAVSANRPPPVSVLDALQTIRLIEKLMERLRT